MGVIQQLKRAIYQERLWSAVGHDDIAEEEVEHRRISLIFEVVDEVSSDDGFSTSRDTSNPYVTDFFSVEPSCVLICCQDPLPCALNMRIQVLFIFARLGVEFCW